VGGGSPFAGAQCASVRGSFMPLFLGCSFTVVSRVLEVAVASELLAVAGLHVGVRAAAAAVAVVVGGAGVAVVGVGVGVAAAAAAAGVDVVVVVVVVDVDPILGLVPGNSLIS
jgi:hypothetical protein